MNLKECERNHLTGSRQLTYADEKDKHVFMHCAGGCIAVTEDAFFDEWLGVFQLHGIKCALPTEFVLSMSAEAKEQSK